MHAKAFHHPQAARDGAIGHGPDDHVGGFGHQRNEVPEGVVGRATGGDFVMRLRLHRVDEVRELDGVLDEEDRHVVTHQVEVAFIRIELHGETAYVAHRVAGTAWALHRGETHEHRSDFLRVLQETRLGQLGMVAIALEIAMGARAPGVHDTLRNALVVEMGDLLAHDEVFKQRGATRPGLERVLVIGDAHALVGAQCLAGRIAAMLFQGLQLAVGIGTIRGVGSGELAVFGRIRFLARHHGSPYRSSGAPCRACASSDRRALPSVQSELPVVAICPKDWCITK